MIKTTLTEHVWRYLWISLLVLVAAVAVIFATIGVLQPLMMDDFSYYNSVIKYREPFSFAAYWYQHWSGRLTTLLLHWVALHDVYTQTIFGALNGLLLAGLGWLATVMALGRKPRLFGQDGIVFALILTALWFCIPALGEVAFWRIGSDAYLWSVASGLLFLLPYRLWIDATTMDSRPWYGLAFFFAGLLIGMHGEQILAGIVILVPYWLFRYGPRPLFRAWSSWPVLGYIGLLVGGVISTLGPGNFNRLRYGDPLTFSLFLHGAVNYWTRMLSTAWPVLAAGTLIFILSLCCGAILRKRHWTALDWLLCAAAASGPLLLLPKFAEDRTLFIPFVMVVIAMASTIELQRVNFPRLRPVLYALGVVAITCTLANGIVELGHTRSVAKDVINRERTIAQLKTPRETDLIVYGIYKPGRLPYVNDISLYKKYWTNTSAAKYYGIRSIRTWN